jgi:hypothetical protein
MMKDQCIDLEEEVGPMPMNNLWMTPWIIGIDE